MPTYPGGKNGSGVFHKIINQIPPHDVYIEGFLGSGAIMRRLRPAGRRFGIDADPDAIQKTQELQLPNLELFNMGFLEWLDEHYYWTDSTNCFVYLDPPYLMETRSTDKAIYTYEFGSQEDHTKLLTTITQLDCPVAISGYPSKLYADFLSEWRTIEYETITRGATKRTEVLWMNYPESTALHDYRYVGENADERWNLTKRKRRWLKKLKDMDRFHRYALLAALEELQPKE